MIYYWLNTSTLWIVMAIVNNSLLKNWPYLVHSTILKQQKGMRCKS